MRLLFFFLTLFFIGPRYFVHGQSNRAYVDLDKAVKSLPEYTLNQNRLQELTNQLEDSLYKITSAYEHYLMSVTPHGRTLDSNEIVHLEDTIKVMENIFLDFQTYAKKELLRTDSLLESTLKEIVQNKLREYSDYTNMEFVVKRDEIFECPDCKDYTDGFLEFLRINETTR